MVLYQKNHSLGGQIMNLTFHVILEKDADGYYVWCPRLKGCHSQGKTVEEAMENIREAVELYLETLSEDEIQRAVSKEILSTTCEVKVA